MSNKTGKNNKKATLMTKRNGLILIALLAALILMVNIITISYSWFEPGVSKTTGISYEATVSVRSEDCTLLTSKKGVSTNGSITYSTDCSSTETVALSGGATEKIQYFETVIQNNSDAPTNVSLYIGSLTYSGSGDYGVGIVMPTNSYHVYHETKTDLYLVRNAYIAPLETDESNNKLVVEWFIKTTGPTVTVDFDSLYFLYN